MTKNRPAHALYGVTQGASSLATSFASGVAGVVLQPLEGAERDGVGGFFKGIGKGLVGVVTKPLVGVFDLASNVTEGIRNTTTVFDGGNITRIRPPRFVGRDGILRVCISSDFVSCIRPMKHADSTLYCSRTCTEKLWV